MSERDINRRFENIVIVFSVLLLHICHTMFFFYQIGIPKMQLSSFIKGKMTLKFSLKLINSCSGCVTNAFTCACSSFAQPSINRGTQVLVWSPSRFSTRGESFLATVSYWGFCLPSTSTSVSSANRIDWGDARLQDLLDISWQKWEEPQCSFWSVDFSVELSHGHHFCSVCFSSLGHELWP